MMFRMLAGVVVVIGCFQVGCSFGPPTVPGPKFDAAGSASQAMGVYDTNTDGELDEKELESCASLAKAIEEIDSDKSGTISAQELKERIDYFIQSRLGRAQLACSVVRRGAPVPGATVTFQPEDFMGDVIQSASGVTNRDGMATIHIDDPNDQMGGIQPGFYRVEISRKSKSGKESLHAKYNTETTLGQEITTGSRALSTGLVFDLK